MPDRLKHIGLVFILALLCGVSATAQKFSVSSFRELPNDVTAFINPVNDLNDEGCALIKVQASPDFAFSTPLGIVKRENMTGEIWLYVPLAVACQACGRTRAEICGDMCEAAVRSHKGNHKTAHECFCVASV